MIHALIEQCLKNRFIVIILFVFVILFGVQAMKRTPTDAIPDIGELQVLVYVDWPGISPKDIEDQVMYPLTTGLMGTPQVKVSRASCQWAYDSEVRFRSLLQR